MSDTAPGAAMSDTAPIRPEPEGLAAEYWEMVQEERVPLQRCGACGHVWHPPAYFCPECGSDSYEWVDASGEGTIQSYTVIHHAVHNAVTGWLPYTVLLVDLAEGPRFIGRLLDGSGELRVGAPVRLEFDRYSDLKVPGFVLGD